jgi:predicted DNA-binding protein (MmcQ/YjbR family)
MNVDDIRAHCLQKENVEEGFPFDEDTLVFKVNGKMFLLVSLTDIPLRFNVKCDPEKAIALREEYMQVQPGYHMSKVHWNTVVTEGGMSRKLLLEQIDHSYDLVAAGSKKKKRS